MQIESIEGPAVRRSNRTKPALRAAGCALVALLLPSLGTGDLDAQVPGRRASPAPELPRQDPNRPVRHSERDHSRTRSLTFFASIDKDSDDRLDIFEFEVGFGVAEDRARRFRELDLDRDGWIDWSEFDADFRAGVERRSEFTIFSSRPLFPLRDPAEPELTIDPRRMIVRSIDLNEDELVQKNEFASFLRDVRLPPNLAEQQFPVLDVDRSGALDLDEFGVVAQNVPGVIERARNQKDPRSSLPLDDRAADSNLDGVLDRAELDSALRLLHPSLGTHAAQILEDADQRNDRRLGGPELFQSRARARAWLKARTQS